MTPSSVLYAVKKKLRLSSNFTRAHERLTCSAVGEVIFIERGCVIRGIVDEVSRGGVRLRPAPDGPLAATTTTSCPSTRPPVSAGSRARVAVVG